MTVSLVFRSTEAGQFDDSHLAHDILRVVSQRIFGRFVW
jgi:hypothetical protein